MINDHLYTTSQREVNNASIVYGYIEEGVACYVFDAATPRTTPFLRLLSQKNGDHFYTTSQNEAIHAINTFGYISEGIACFVLDSPTPGAVPLYRLYNQSNGDHFYTISQDEANNAIAKYGYKSEGIACYAFNSSGPGTIPFIRALKIKDPKKSSWAILLCKFKNDSSEPPNAPGVLPFKSVCENFFTQTDAGNNVVRFFSDMSHGSLDLSDSKVFGWYTIEVNIIGYTKDGPVYDVPDQGKRIGKAIQAAKDAGVLINNFDGVVVIMNVATGEAQGTKGWMVADWRRVDGRNFDGTLGMRAPGSNGTEVFGQDMGHGYGLGHSRQEDLNVDYQDGWDIMSTVGWAFGSSDVEYCAKGPGLNAWNMRGRGWLDESRIWKSQTNSDFSHTIRLRPLHQRNLTGYLGAELPGIGNHSPYLVEFRVPELWDAGILNAAILVHRFSGNEEFGQYYSPNLVGDNSLNTHSYLMKGSMGQLSLLEGDVFEIGNGPYSRVKVLTIDSINKIATVQLCYSTLPKTAPSATIVVPAPNHCVSALIEGSTCKFIVKLTNNVCAANYTILWKALGASPAAGEQMNEPSFIIDIPEQSGQITVSVQVNFDDGAVASDSFHFTPISQEEASWRQFICNVLNERLKPIPWWKWDPEKIKRVLSEYSSDDLARIEHRLARLLKNIKHANV